MIAFFSAEIYKTGYSGPMQWGYFSLISAAIGFLSGWNISGKYAGAGMRAAMGNGLRTSFVIVFYCLILFAVIAMLKRSLMNLYEGIMDALMGIFDYIMQFGAELLRPEPLITLIVGGMLAGILVERTARKWP